MQATAEFVSNLASAPTGAEAIHEVPEPVQAELLAAGFQVGTFLKLLPQILALVKLVTSEGATVAEVIAAVFALLNAFRPEGS